MKLLVLILCRFGHVLVVRGGATLPENQLLIELAHAAEALVRCLCVEEVE